MSGIFGIVDPTHKLNIEELTQYMTQLMSHEAWFVTQSCVDAAMGVSLGQLGIGIFNQTPQPVWDETQTTALVMAGEFYNIACEYHCGLPTEHIALQLYQQFGKTFIKYIDGVFLIAILDKKRQQLSIFNDRFGLYPLYYSYQADCFVFAPETKGILHNPVISKKLDMVALAQYMRFQQVLGNRTFFEGIELMPNSTILTFDIPTKQLSFEPYWTYEDIPYKPHLTFDEAAEEAGYLLKRAVRRLSTDDEYRSGVYLSGGLDARTIAGMVEKRPLPTLTYGTRHCRDVYYAAKIAKVVGSDHHWVDLPDGNWVKDVADAHLTLTEGYHSWIHAHGMSTLGLARQIMDVNLTGWDGGSLLGDSDTIEPLQQKAPDDLAITVRLFNLFNQTYTWPSLTEAEDYFLYHPAIKQTMRGLAWESFCDELRPYLKLRPDVRTGYFYIDQHCRRSTQNLVTFARSHIEMRFPFFDYQLFEFLFSLPAYLRRDKLLLRAIIQQHTPHLANIPYNKDLLPPSTKRRVRWPFRVANFFKGRLNKYLENCDDGLFKYALHSYLKKTPFHLHTLYADYENYLRDELWDWANNTLFAPTTRERNLFDEAFLHSLMQRHKSGIEEWTIGKIAPVMTYEMMLRKFYD